MKVAVTGGAGFIGSVLVGQLIEHGASSVFVIDNPGTSPKWKNIAGKKIADYIHRDDLLSLLDRNAFPNVDAIVHLGGSSSTTVIDQDYLLKNNFEYSKKVALYAFAKKIRFLYASSAATYGDGAWGYDDNDNSKYLGTLTSLNGYGFSKSLFDLWCAHHEHTHKCVGLKFFNVFGPNEYHKGDQLSVVYKAFIQAQSKGSISLFKSYHPKYAHGEQKRDFVYVKECARIMRWFLQNPGATGIFNIGRGSAHSWNELALGVFHALGMTPCIEYIEMPDALQGQYQYFTEANMKKLHGLPGFAPNTSTFHEEIAEYVRGYLLHGPRYA
jgi:ADP-L-glycero-D-manno-heptose 6-epimerase